MKQLRTGIHHATVRLALAAACGAGAVLPTARTLNANEGGSVVSVSVEPTNGRAQIAIGIDGDIRVRDFVLRAPDRIVIDISGARLGVKGGYDRVARGGILDVRYSQWKPEIVRIVLTLDGPRGYDVARNKGSIIVAVDGGSNFAAWRSNESARVASVAPVLGDVTVAPRPTSPPARVVIRSPEPSVIPVDFNSFPQQSTGRRVSARWEKASIIDVIAQFADWSGRTIIPAGGVTGEITAEIKDKPWDVAMKVILNANGFDAVEDENGIFIVNTLAALVAKPRTESLTTVTVRFNYTAAVAVAAALQGRLTRDCGGSAAPAGAPAGAAQQQPQGASALNCPVRGAVTADSLTNSVSITDAPSAIPDLVQYAKTLDVRQPQVNIKAKIILVDRTQLEGLGLKYDIGSRNQHFNDLVSRLDSAGQPETGNVIFLGGNTMSAIANASAQVGGAALSIVYSAALGAFDFTTFLDALQEVSLLDVQAEPSVTTLNYRTATLSAGTQVPIRTTEQGAGGNASGQLPQVTVNLKQTGIVLTVTPFITNNRQVKMKVHAENSDVQFLAGDAGALFPTQQIDNEVLVGDGETAVMGGLTQTSVRMTRTGIPLLVELPLIGRLFGVTNRSETKRDLLILITPHIVDQGDMTMEPRRSP